MHRPASLLALLSATLVCVIGCGRSPRAESDGSVGPNMPSPDGSMGDAGVGDVDGGPIGTGNTGSATIGPSGGAVEVDGLVLTVPAGALTEAVEIRVTSTLERAPNGYRPYSPVYRFEPAGLTFGEPVELRIPFEGDAQRAVLFWSDRDEPARFERLGGTAAGSSLVQSVTHFSRGFVADGIVYDEPADRSCIVTRSLDQRYTAPSGLALFFAAEDCQGRPFTQLEEQDFVVLENGQPLTFEARPIILPARGLQVFVTLSLDFSASNRAVRPQILEGARAFVDRLEQDGLPVQVQVEVFAGEYPSVRQSFTLDLDRVRQVLAGLATYTPQDEFSTNLHGAIVGLESTGLQGLSAAQAAFRTRNQGGALTTGYLVLFTDGVDNTSRHSAQEARNAHKQAPERVVIVGLRGANFNPAAMQALEPDLLLVAPEGDVLEREFAAIAYRIRGQMAGTYLLGYCTPRRTGNHTVAITLRDAQTSNASVFEFDATGFGPGCTPSSFESACDGLECGGLACGACDDRTAICQQNRCVSYCSVQNRCGGRMITNPHGYAQVCEDQETSFLCGETCRNLMIDRANCGACGNQCASTASCVDGECRCPNDLTHCTPGQCVDLNSTTAHCGTCGNACPTGGSCASGECVCPANHEVCGGACTTFTTRTNCGSCGNSCATGGSCVSGTCVCPADHGVCNGACTAFTSTENCGWCGNVCHGRCRESSCAGVDQLSVGGNHSCARLVTGEVTCWGSNEHGQLGFDGSWSERPTPNDVLGLTDAIAVSAGYEHTCAVRSTGDVLCWGHNYYRQLGSYLDGAPFQVSSTVPVAVRDLTDAVAITAGFRRTCAVRATGAVMCWGMDGFQESVTPVAVNGLNDAVAVSASGDHACAVRSTGAVVCWGRGERGQLGNGSTNSSSFPVPVTGLLDAVAVSTGWEHTCALRETGAVVCWGRGESGELGNGFSNGSNVPVPVMELTDAVAVSCAGSRTCAVRATGAVVCWGTGSVWLGNLVPGNSGFPVPVTGLTDAVAVADGGWDTCAVRATGAVVCWGRRPPIPTEVVW